MRPRRRCRPGVPSALLLLVACGGGGEGPLIPDLEPGPEPEPTLELVGDSVFAIDLANRFLIFGTESPGTINRLLPIQGLPAGHRIVGADFRRSDRRLYGVGTDSRVYTIDTETAVATPVSDTPFSPAIFIGFDVHFGMAMHPRTERIHLISAESGANWIIDPDDGTATAGSNPTYAAGDPNEGATPHIAGLAFGPPPQGFPGAAARPSGTVAGSVAGIGAECDDLLYALDPNLKYLIGTCDPELADWTSLLEMQDVSIPAGCVEIVIADGPLVGWITSWTGEDNELRKLEYTTEGNYGYLPPKTIEADSPIQSIMLRFANDVL